MKTFTVTIWAYDHYAKFNVLSEDNAIALEQYPLQTGRKEYKLGISWDIL